MSWYNPATWTVVDNLQGQNKKAPAKSPYANMGSTPDVPIGRVQDVYPYSQWLNDQKYGAQTSTGGGAAPAAPSANVAVGGGGGGGYDPAAAQAAADAAKAAALRGSITTIANTIKDIFNSRYGQVDQAGAEQVNKLQDRFNTESQDITQKVEGENQQLGAAHASSGSFDSSYRGNNVDTVTRGGEAQIRDLGTELEENRNKVGGWINQQKAGFDAQKGGIDSILSHLAESTDPGELTQIRNTLESRIAELRAQSADNNTMGQNRAALDQVAPSAVRAQQLKTTLSQIVAGNADKGQKSIIGQKLINSANLSDDDKNRLLVEFNGTLNQEEQKALA